MTAGIRPVGEDLVLIEAAGRRIVASARCPHRGGLLRFAYLDEQRLQVRCPLHQSSFDLTDGHRVAGPACDPIRIVAELAAGATVPPPEELLGCADGVDK